MSTIASSRTDTAFPRLANARFPLPEAWHESAPTAVTQADGWDDGDAGWRAWRRHLDRRGTRHGAGELWLAETSPLLWSLPGGLESSDAPASVAEIHEQCGAERGQALADLLRTWLEAAGDRPASVELGLECLAWCHALPRAARRASAGHWWEALSLLARAAEDAAALDLEGDPLCHQLLAGELPLSLAAVFPELEPCRALASSGRRALGAGMSALLDADGHPRGALLNQIRPLWACWTRSRALLDANANGAAKSDTLDASSWEAAAEQRYRGLFVHLVRMSRKDGGQALVQGPPAAWRPELFETALKLAGRGRERRSASLVLPGCRRQGADDGQPLPPASAHSESADLAVLRRRWSPGSEVLTVAYAGRQVRCEFQIGRDVLWSGTWNLELRLDGTAIEQVGDWDDVCWVSDEDVDYLEIEAPFAGGFHVQRQMLLARKDRVLLLADAVVGAASSNAPASRPARRIDYRATLPLRPGISFTAADETREGRLTGRKTRASVLPLALPEWKSDYRTGELAWSDEGLCLTQSADASALFAPLFIDLDPRRRDLPLTWRQLTIGENRAIVPAETAVGYRVQIGPRQWLVYRSLAAAANRTLLGSNLVTQFLLARFTRKGTVKELLEIE